MLLQNDGPPGDAMKFNGLSSIERLIRVGLFLIHVFCFVKEQNVSFCQYKKKTGKKETNVLPLQLSTHLLFFLSKYILV